MKKTQIVLIVSVIFCLLFLNACGSSTKGNDTQSTDKNTTSSAKPSNVTLKFYNMDDGADAEYTKRLIEKFESDNPNVKIESIPLVPGNSVESLKKLDIILSSGEQIDLMKFPNIEGVLERAGQGVLAKLNDLYSNDNVVPEEEYYINPQIDGNYYGTMFTSGTWFILLNEDALKDAGLEVPSFDWTWDDFRDYAKKLTKDEGSNKQYGAYFHTWGLYSNPIAFFDRKNPYVTEELKPQFDDPSFTYFFNLRKAMELEDKSVKPLSDVIGAKLDYKTEFNTGRAAMLLTSQFAIPSLADTDKYPHTFKTVVAPMPRSSEDSPEGRTIIGGGFASIAETSKYKEEAYKFIRYMSTEQEYRTEQSGWKKADNSSIIDRLYGPYSEVVDLPSLTATLNDERISTASSSEISIAYGNQLGKILEDGFAKFMLDNMSIEKTQKWMQDEAEKVMARSKK